MDKLYLYDDLLTEREKLKNKLIEVEQDIKTAKEELKYRIKVNCDRCDGTGKTSHVDGLPTSCKYCCGRGYQCMRPCNDKITYIL